MPGKQNLRRQSTVALAAGIPVSKPTPQKKKKETADEVPAGRARKKCARGVANLKPI